MMTQSVEDLVRAAAPLSQEDMEKFMSDEAGRYRPNRRWKLNYWLEQNPYAIFPPFLLAIVLFDAMFFSREPLALISLWRALYYSIIVVFALRVVPFLGMKGPVAWYELPHELWRLYPSDPQLDLVPMPVLGPRCYIQVLRRTSSKYTCALAIVGWLVVLRIDGSPLRRGVFAFGFINRS